MQIDAGMLPGNSNTMSDVTIGDIFSEKLNTFLVSIQFCKKYSLPSVSTVVTLLENPVVTKLQEVLCVCHRVRLQAQRLFTKTHVRWGDRMTGFIPNVREGKSTLSCDTSSKPKFYRETCLWFFWLCILPPYCFPSPRPCFPPLRSHGPPAHSVSQSLCLPLLPRSSPSKTSPGKSSLPLNTVPTPRDIASVFLTNLLFLRFWFGLVWFWGFVTEPLGIRVEGTDPSGAASLVWESQGNREAHSGDSGAPAELGGLDLAA